MVFTELPAKQILQKPQIPVKPVVHPFFETWKVSVTGGFTVLVNYSIH